MRFWSSSAVLIGARAPANAAARLVASNASDSGSTPSRRRARAFDPGAFHEVHRAEAARVVEDDARAIVELEDDVVMRGELRPLVMERRHNQYRLALDAERARHAKMHHQRLAAIQRSEQILGAPRQRLDPPAGEPLGEARRERRAQIAAPGLDLGEARAHQRRREASAHGFDFGQFRHRRARE